MDDSNILYYLALAAIYIISRVLKKKKPEDQSAAPEQTEAPSQPRRPEKRPASIEDLLKELTQEIKPDEPKGPDPEPQIRPVVTQERKPAPEPVRPKVIDYQKENIEAVGPGEEIDIVPHKLIHRDKPEYKRSEKFALADDDNETVAGIYKLLEDEDGPRKAIIMKEIFDRKY